MRKLIALDASSNCSLERRPWSLQDSSVVYVWGVCCWRSTRCRSCQVIVYVEACNIVSIESLGWEVASGGSLWWRDHSAFIISIDVAMTKIDYEVKSGQKSVGNANVTRRLSNCSYYPIWRQMWHPPNLWSHPPNLLLTAWHAGGTHLGKLKAAF